MLWIDVRGNECMQVDDEDGNGGDDDDYGDDYISLRLLDIFSPCQI